MYDISSSNIVNRIIIYIEENIHKKISLEDISDYSNLSKFHLHRVFKALTGRKLMNYVKCRKLTRSVDDLLNTNLRVIDIASEYNFEYEQSYIRAFINTFSLSPDEFRKKRCQLNITDKFILNHFSSIGDNGIFIEPVIAIRPSFYVIGLKVGFTYKDNQENSTLAKLVIDFYRKYRQQIPNAKYPYVYIGIIDQQPDRAGMKYYTASCEVSGLEDIPDGLCGRVVSTGKYAIFKYVGLHGVNEITAGKLLDIYKIMREWLDKSGYFLSAGFNLERIDLSNVKEDYCEMEIYLPIRDRQDRDSPALAEHTAYYKAIFNV